jgi:hypothetical protein
MLTGTLMHRIRVFVTTEDGGEIELDWDDFDKVIFK